MRPLYTAILAVVITALTFSQGLQAAETTSASGSSNSTAQNGTANSTATNETATTAAPANETSTTNSTMTNSSTPAVSTTTPSSDETKEAKFKVVLGNLSQTCKDNMDQCNGNTTTFPELKGIDLANVSSDDICDEVKNFKTCLLKMQNGKVCSATEFERMKEVACAHCSLVFGSTLLVAALYCVSKIFTY